MLWSVLYKNGCVRLWRSTKTISICKLQSNHYHYCTLHNGFEVGTLLFIVWFLIILAQNDLLSTFNPLWYGCEISLV